MTIDIAKRPPKIRKSTGRFQMIEADRPSMEMRSGRGLST